MVRLLPFVLIPILLIAGLGAWRYLAARQSLEVPKAALQNEEESPDPLEVPKTLPEIKVEEQLNTLRPVSSPSNASISTPDPRIAVLESTIADLKNRVTALEQVTPAPVSSSLKYPPLYIPLGSGGGPWNDQSWFSLNEYQVAITPDNYSGYSSMQLEVNFRLVEAAGTGSVRVYNLTDNASVSSQVDTTSASFGVQNSSTFKLPSGQKTYTLQVKSSQNKAVFIQSARIKVNF